MTALRPLPPRLAAALALIVALAAPARLAADCLSLEAAAPGVAAAATPEAVSETSAEAAYVSSRGERLTARFDIPAKNVRLALPDGRTLTLPLAVSGSGARYSNGAQTFWEHQGGAIFEERGVLLFEGREAPAR